MSWDKWIVLGDRCSTNNNFGWERGINKLPGTETYECRQPWVYKDSRYGLIASELLFLCGKCQSHRTYKSVVLVGLKNMGFDVLVSGNKGCTKKGPTPLSINMAVGGKSNKYPGRDLWISFTRHMG